jgi:hypothetical protein
MMTDQLASQYRYDPATGLLFKKHKRGGEHEVGSRNVSTRYLELIFEGKKYQAHRVAWLLQTGSWPKGFIDHINGVRDDNRIENLRDVSSRENQMNSKMNSRNTSGVVGVVWRWKTKTWEASIKVFGKRIHLGNYADISHAAAARKSAEKEHGFHPNHGRAA